MELDKDRWTARELADHAARGFRARRPGELPICGAQVRPNDYANELRRGTVEYVAGWNNYSNHATVLEPGSEVRGCNFAQPLPDTAAIVCDGALTLIGCNLVNVRLDPRWIVEGCNTAQSWLVDEGEGRLTRQYICAHPGLLSGKETPPANVVRP